MLKKNNKAFVLTETLVVTTFLVTIMTFIYISIIPLIGKYEDKIERDSNIDVVYKLYHLRKMIQNDSKKSDIYNNDVKYITCKDLENKDKCIQLVNNLELKNFDLIYIKSIKNNINEISSDKLLREYLEKNKDSNEETLILYDKDNHLLIHLKNR